MAIRKDDRTEEQRKTVSRILSDKKEQFYVRKNPLYPDEIWYKGELINNPQALHDFQLSAIEQIAENNELED